MDDAAFVALADEDRRQLLSLLATTREEDPPVTVPEDLTAGRGDSPKTATRLHHVHLPKLASMDYVEWDVEAGTVRRGPVFEELEPLLDALHEHQGLAGD
jgi:hypothetical protein